MTEQLAIGIGLVLVAGLLNGSFAAPMKGMTAWRWENSWLIFAITGLIIFPWIITFLTVPHVGGVYSGTSPAILWKVTLFGITWGVGSTLFGIGISRVGMALGFAIILGITASFGSLFPLAVLHPEELHTRHGEGLMLGTAVMIVGLLFLALAGKRRERDMGATGTARSGFFLGLMICIFSGLFSSMLNFQFRFRRRDSRPCSCIRSEQFDGCESHMVFDGNRRFSFEPGLLLLPSQQEQKLERVPPGKPIHLLAAGRPHGPSLVWRNGCLRHGRRFAGQARRNRGLARVHDARHHRRNFLGRG